MKRFIIIALALFHSHVFAINPGQFLFMPLPTTVIAAPLFNGTPTFWDVYDFTMSSKTYTVTNDGNLTSSAISVSLTTGNGAFTIASDSCTTITLAPAASCDVTVNYNGFPESPSQFILNVTDGTASWSTMMQYCPAC